MTEACIDGHTGMAGEVSTAGVSLNIATVFDELCSKCENNVCNAHNQIELALRTQNCIGCKNNVCKSSKLV